MGTNLATSLFSVTLPTLMFFNYYSFTIGDAPWWKQFLVAIGLGGFPVIVVLVVFVVILLLIIVLVIFLLLLFVCKNRYIKPGSGATGGRQKCKYSFF